MTHANDEAFINVQTSYPIPAHVPRINSSLTVGKFASFQEIESERMNYGVIVRH